MKTKLIILVLMICGIFSFLYADSLQDTMEKLSSSAGKSYVDPFSQALAVDFNGGWFHKVPKAELFGWDFEFGVVAMGSFFNSSEKTFQTNNAPFRFNDEQAQALVADQPAQYQQPLIDYIVSHDFNVNFSGPTIIGDKYDDTTGANSINANFEGATITVSGQDILIPAQSVPLKVGGLLTDLPAMPLGAPQLTLGTVAGTQVSIRYIPNVTINPTIGAIDYQGFGIQHNPAFWLPVKLPVDVALAFFTQKLKVGDIAEINGTTVGLNVAKTFGKKLLSVTPYAGVDAESAKMKFHYNYIVDVAGQPVASRVAFEIKGKNTTRGTVGLNFILALINLNVDYNIGKYSSATAGLMFNFSF
jgi:hypothetical protein